MTGRDLSDKEHVTIRKAIKGAIRRLARHEDYDDFYQSAWVAVLSALPRFDAKKGKLSTFAYDIAKGSMLDKMTKDVRRKELLQRVPLADRFAVPERPWSNMSDEEEKMVWDALNSIKPCHARAFVDRYVNEMMVPDVAARAGVTLRTAEFYILKGRKALQAKLCGWGRNNESA